MAENGGMKVLDQHVDDGCALYHGDCVEVIQGIPDNSVGLSVYSPPFASLYTYSDSERDMGNCSSHDEFGEHYAFLVGDIFRATMPGRLTAVHCMIMPTSKARDGYIGARDFPGQIIQLHEEKGWIFHAEVCIWKDPVTAMQRTKALGLLHKQIKKDSCMSRMGFPDKVLLFRKPGDNPEPVTHTNETFPVAKWQKYASPVWMDINPSNTLQYRSAREHKDEKHICLAEGSLVLTRDMGYIPIEDVKVGAEVLTHRGRWRSVTAKRCNGVKDTVRVCAQGVAHLVTTPDHRLYARLGSGPRAKEHAKAAEPGWLQAQESLGSYVNLKLPPVESTSLTEREWWIVGRWLADGHRGARQTSGARGAGFGEFIVSCGRHKLEDLLAILGDNAGQQLERTATQVTLRGLRHEVRELLSRCGRGAAGKGLPGEAFCLDEAHAEALLSGYISGDGHYVPKHDRTQASSVSRELMLGMSMVAMRARGVVASVYAGRPARTGTIQGREVRMRQDWIFAFRNSPGHKPSGWIDDQGSWRKVRKVEAHDACAVWDLQVEEDESFTAEGCVVHNCPLQLDVIERVVEMYSNEGDTVLSPFMGIGSEGYVARQNGRRFVGIELKHSYYRQAVENVAKAAVAQQGLFGGAA